MDGRAVTDSPSCRQIRIGHSLRANNIHICLAIRHPTPYILRFNPTLPIRITIDDEGWNGGVHYPQRNGLENGIQHEPHGGWKRIHNASREGVIRERPIQHIPIVIASGIVEMGCIRDDVDEPARGVSATTVRPAARTVGATLWGTCACSPSSVNRDVHNYLLGRLGEDVKRTIRYLHLHHLAAGARLLQVFGESGFRHNAAGCDDIHVEGA